MIGGRNSSSFSGKSARTPFAAARAASRPFPRSRSSKLEYFGASRVFRSTTPSPTTAPKLSRPRTLKLASFIQCPKRCGIRAGCRRAVIQRYAACGARCMYSPHRAPSTLAAPRFTPKFLSFFTPPFGGEKNPPPKEDHYKPLFPRRHRPGGWGGGGGGAPGPPADRGQPRP